MPIRSRLLSFVIIVAVLSLTANAWAVDKFAKSNPVTESTGSASSTSEFPFDNQSIPSAPTVVETETANAPATTTAQSSPQKRAPTDNLCYNNSNNTLQKSLLVTAFPRLTPNSANAGALDDAEHQLPKLLSLQLEAQHKTLTPVQISEALPSPSLSSENLFAQQIQRLARNQDTQLVLTGEIIDMNMAHPEATYNPGLYTRFLNGLFDFIETRNRFDKRSRLFSFDVTLRDGFTGQTLFRKRYATYGLWNQTKPVGFATPLFWKTDYGQQIQGLVNLAAKDVGAVVQCQPFITHINSRPGQTQILLQGGANNGLRAGDTLALYQMVVQGSETEYQQHHVRLVNRNAAIELREVYPSHSVAVMSGSTYLTGQFLAVAQ